MKKSRRILLLCGVLLSLFCFVGCTQSSVEESDSVSTESQTDSADRVISDLSSQTDSETPSTDVSSSDTKSQEEVITDSHVTDSYSGRWTSDAYFVDTVDGLGTEDVLLFENDTYRIERINGACYLTFLEGKKPQKLDNSGCVLHDESIVFKSADNLFNSLARVGLDEYAQQQVRSFFTQKDTERYCIADPYHFLLPVLPGYEKPGSVQLRDDRLCVTYYPSGNAPAGLKPRLKFNFVTKESYEEREAWVRGKFISPENATDTVFCESDRNATVYYESSFGSRPGTWRKYYVLQDGSKTLYVLEKYILECNTGYYAEFVSETIPTEIYVYGTDGTSFFSIEGRYLGFRPTVDWLLSIETAPYVPKQ